MKSCLLSLAKFLLAAFVLTGVGCFSGETPPTDSLVVALSAPPNTLDPRWATDATGMRITDLMFSSLVRVGPELEVIGDAAERWTYSSEKKEYTFFLKPNLKFSDGVAVTPQDIEASFKQYLAPASPFRSSFEAIEWVQASVLKDHHERLVVAVKLKNFLATLLVNLSRAKILGPKLIASSNPSIVETKGAGSGAYFLSSQGNNEIVLTKNTHHVPQAKSEKIIFKIIRDDNTRYLKMIKGALDIAQSEISPIKIPTLEKNSDLSVIRYPGLSMSYLLLNMKDKIFKNIGFRQALSQSLNRQEIIRYKLENLATPATSILPPSSQFFHKGLSVEPWSPKVFKERSQTLGLKGTELTLKSSNNPSTVENAKIIAHQMEQIGIHVKVQSFEWGTFYSDVQSGNFQIALLRWVGAFDPDIYRIAFHSSEVSPGRNRGSYMNPDLDRLLDEGLLIEDQEKRAKHYERVQEIILNDLPIIPLWYDTEVAVVHRRVRGYKPQLNGDFSSLVNAYK